MTCGMSKMERGGRKGEVVGGRFKGTFQNTKPRVSPDQVFDEKTLNTPLVQQMDVLWNGLGERGGLKPRFLDYFGFKIIKKTGSLHTALHFKGFG